MIVAALVALLAAQQIVVLLIVKTSADERRRFLAAVMSKNPGEFVAVERATAPRAKKPKKQRDESVPPQPYGL